MTRKDWQTQLKNKTGSQAKERSPFPLEKASSIPKTRHCSIRETYSHTRISMTSLYKCGMHSTNRMLAPKPSLKSLNKCIRSNTKTSRIQSQLNKKGSTAAWRLSDQFPTFLTHTYGDTCSSSVTPASEITATCKGMKALSEAVWQGYAFSLLFILVVIFKLL